MKLEWLPMQDSGGVTSTGSNYYSHQGQSRSCETRWSRFSTWRRGVFKQLPHNNPRKVPGPRIRFDNLRYEKKAEIGALACERRLESWKRMQGKRSQWLAEQKNGRLVVDIREREKQCNRLLLQRPRKHWCRPASFIQTVYQSGAQSNAQKPWFRLFFLLCLVSETKT